MWFKNIFVTNSNNFILLIIKVNNILKFNKPRPISWPLFIYVAR